MNIVYGGAFNPLSLAHINIIELILKRYKNSKVIVVPVGNDYLKAELIDFNYRFEMIKEEFLNNERVIVSKIEMENKFNGTINTLNLLSKKYEELVLLVGSDNIVNFDKWIDYEDLLKNYKLLIIKRDNINIDLVMNKYKYLNCKYEVLEFDSLINSSLIRTDLEKYKKWLSPKTYNYIKKNKLYGVGLNV